MSRQSLSECVTGTSWCGHGASRSLSKWSLDGAGLVGLPLGRDVAPLLRLGCCHDGACRSSSSSRSVRTSPRRGPRLASPCPEGCCASRRPLPCRRCGCSRFEELKSRTRHAARDMMDEGGACRAVLERRNGVVVGCIREFGAALGEASDVLALALPRLLLAVAQLPLLAGRV
jgi:hypothetical protein